MSEAQTNQPEAVAAPVAAPVARRAAPVPSAGRMVLYVSRDGLNRWPAVVTKVTEPGNPFSSVDLAVFAGNSTVYQWGVTYKAEANVTRTWHWPPFVPPVEVDA